MPLNELAVENAKPQRKPFRLWDERGLYLLVTPAGSKLWRLKYQFAGKEQTLVLGAYPEVTLDQAREKCEKARLSIIEGRNPFIEQKAAKLWQALEARTSFKAIALGFLEQMRGRWTEQHRKNSIRRLETYVFPALESRPICQIESADLRAALCKIEALGAYQTAARVRTLCIQILKYGASCGACSPLSVTDLKRGLMHSPKKARLRPCVDGQEPEITGI